MECPHKDLYEAIIAIGLAAHSFTLWADYLIGKAESIESNSLVELILKGIKARFKKKEEPNGEQKK